MNNQDSFEEVLSSLKEVTDSPVSIGLLGTSFVTILSSGIEVYYSWNHKLWVLSSAKGKTKLASSKETAKEALADYQAHINSIRRILNREAEMLDLIL